MTGGGIFFYYRAQTKRHFQYLEGKKLRMDNKQTVKESRVCPLSCSSHLRLHEGEPGPRVRRSMQAPLYAHMHSLVGEEQSGDIMQGQEEINPPVSTSKSSLTVTLARLKSKCYCIFQLLRSQLSPERFRFARVKLRVTVVKV